MPPHPADVAPLNVLLFGGGGREHAIAASLKSSPRLGSLHLTDSTNPGLLSLGTPVTVPVDIREAYRLVQYCDAHKINLVVIGPEEPLAQGFADKLATPTRLVFGPTADGARLEADKAWSKHLMRAASIPTADARCFTDPAAAKQFIESRTTPHVVKAAGLAKGKGVIVPSSMKEALDAIDLIMVKRAFGDAGREIVIEEKLDGIEVSILALVDGSTIYVLEPCQDHKRLLDGDKGPNTGGMGAYCPASFLTDSLLDRVQREVLVPTVDALKRDGIDFRGVLYAGIMLTHAGPKVLEFNCRFGDPECQAILPRLKTDLLDVLYATAAGRLDTVELVWDQQVSCCVVLAAGGYPEKPALNVPIEGIDAAAALPGVRVYHAGTRRNPLAKTGSGIVTAGGRVLNVVALGDTLADARERAYAACDLIDFPGKQLRRDIGASAPQPR